MKRRRKKEEKVEIKQNDAATRETLIEAQPAKIQGSQRPNT